MATAIQQYELPAEFRRLGGMEADYIDLFTISTRDVVDASPERWARTVIEDVAGLGGQLIWRGVLGLRLEQGPPNERVGGWKIAGSGGDWIRLEASSWCMTAHLVLRLHESRVWAGTFVRYDNPVGRIIWTPASAVHRRLMPGLLEKTLRVRVRRSNRGNPPKDLPRGATATTPAVTPRSVPRGGRSPAPRAPSWPPPVPPGASRG